MDNRTSRGFTDASRLFKALELLGTLLERRSSSPVGLVVCGGSALIALGLVSRVTNDVDVVGLIAGGNLNSLSELPGPLLDAAEIAALELALPKDWLNPGPASLMNDHMPDQGLPSGFRDRLMRRDFGPVLSVYFISRKDQIHFKLFAAADKGGPSVHFTDLTSLRPTDEELLEAVAWAKLHDPSPSFSDTVKAMLKAMERTHVVQRI